VTDKLTASSLRGRAPGRWPHRRGRRKVPPGTVSRGAQSPSRARPTAWRWRS